MEYLKKLSFISAITVLLTGCSLFSASPQAEEEYTTLSLFSDVSFWNFPGWSLEDGTVTAGVSKKTGVVLDISNPPQEADKQLSLLLLKDELPDLISVVDSAMFRQLINSGKVWKLDELLQKYSPDSHLLTRFPDDMRQEQIHQYGAWYSIPSHMNSADARAIWKEPTSYYEDWFRYQHNYGIIWNRSLMEQAGLTAEDLQTESQILNAFEKIKSLKLSVDGEEVIPLMLEGNDYQTASLSYLNSTFGAEQIDENGDYIEKWLQPECKDALKFCNTAFRRGYAHTEHLAIDNQQMRTLVNSGRVFCYIGNTSNTSITAADWISTGPILADSGKYPVFGMEQTTPAGWIQTFVSKSCKYPEKLVRFLEYVTSDEGFLYTNYGDEGTDFYYDDDGLVRRTEEGRRKAADPQNALTMFWNFYSTAWEHSITPPPEPDSKESMLSEIQTAFVRNPATHVYDLSLFRLPDNYITSESELGQIRTALETFRKEQIPLILSAPTDEEFEKQYQIFMEHQKELGVKKLDAKINEQMHRNFEYYGKTLTKVNKP